jgi:hypothetical protein
VITTKRTTLKRSASRATSITKILRKYYGSGAYGNKHQCEELLDGVAGVEV